MKFTVDTRNFDEAIRWISKSVAERQSIPSMSGIHMVLHGDLLKLSSTNGRTSSELVLSVAGAEEGAVLVPGEAIRKIVPALHKDMPIEFSTSGDVIQIKSGKAKFNLKTMPANDFPLLPSIEANTPVTRVDAKSFVSLFKHVYRSIAISGNHTVLSGVKMEFAPNRLTFVGTDTFRLALKSITIDSTITEDIVVDVKALEQVSEAAKSIDADIEMAIVDSKIIFSIADYKLIATLREGDYPSYRALIPTSDLEEIVFNRADMIDIVKRMSIIGTITGAKSVPGVLLEFMDDTVTISVDTTDVGRSEESLPLTTFTEKDKGKLAVQFNYTYLGLALESFTADELRMTYKMMGSGVIIEPVEQEAENVSEALCLIMPIKM